MKFVYYNVRRLKHLLRISFQSSRIFRKTSKSLKPFTLFFDHEKEKMTLLRSFKAFSWSFKVFPFWKLRRSALWDGVKDKLAMIPLPVATWDAVPEQS